MLEVMLSDKTMIMSRNLSRVFNKKMIFEIFASQLYPLSVVSFQANGYYLKPYYDEVVKERQEREAWDKL